MVLDGELVVLDDQGRAQFEPLRRRALMRNPKSIVAASRETPAAVFAFDLIALRGQDLRSYPLTATSSTSARTGCASSRPRPS
jgi:bifunctional non-homologous end joining protein LigD